MVYFKTDRMMKKRFHLFSEGEQEEGIYKFNVCLAYKSAWTKDVGCVRA